MEDPAPGEPQRYVKIPMDTTYLEYTAEDLIAHKLQRGGLLVAKPKFDRDGTDLIALMEVADGAKFCRIQCKGRSLISSNNSNVTIPKEYVKGAFFVFLYVDIGNNEPHIFCFSAKEIIRYWKLKTDKKTKKEIYYLGISKKSFLAPDKESNFLGYSLTSGRIDQIKEIIRKSVSKNEIELFEFLKQQQDLIKKQDELYRLSKIVDEIKHSEESLKQIKNTQTILENQYTTELSKIGSELPVKLVRDISKLLKENIPVAKILAQVKNNIPADIPKKILKEYITKIMKSGS